MATLAQFRSLFPEFRTAGDDYVSAHLDMTAPEVSSDVWGDKYDQGVLYLTAHKLALSPFGNTAKLTFKEAGMTMTTYWKHYKYLRSQVAHGYRVA